MSQEALAQLSNNALYSATVVYALAMLAHVCEWAMARELPNDQAAGRDRANQVPIGAVRAASSASVGRAAPPAGGSSADARVDDGADGGGVDAARSDRFGRIALSLTVLGLTLQLTGVMARGLAADRVPWGSMYEFAITGSMMVVIAYLVLLSRYPVRWLGLLVTGFVTVVLGIAVLVLYRPVAPLVPALHSYWLVIHVFAAAIAGGALTIGALASVLYLMRDRVEVRAAADPGLDRRGFVWRMPEAETIDRVAYRMHAFAFPLWTFAVLAGAIWAEYAWGRFWGWDPKEVWAFITWVVYAAYLHARATAGWRGRNAAFIALLGYATFIFNFVGINIFGSGLHSYAGM